MANVKTSAAGRNAALAALAALLDGGTLTFYTGTRPATPETAASGTLLAQMTLGNPAFSAASGGSIVANVIGDVSIPTSGTAGYCRLADSSGNGVIDGDVGTIGSGAFIEVSSTAFTSTVTIHVNSLTLNLPIGS